MTAGVYSIGAAKFKLRPVLRDGAFIIPGGAMDMLGHIRQGKAYE